MGQRLTIKILIGVVPHLSHSLCSLWSRSVLASLVRRCCWGKRLSDGNTLKAEWEIYSEKGSRATSCDGEGSSTARKRRLSRGVFMAEEGLIEGVDAGDEELIGGKQRLGAGSQGLWNRRR